VPLRTLPLLLLRLLRLLRLPQQIISLHHRVISAIQIRLVSSCTSETVHFILIRVSVGDAGGSCAFISSTASAACPITAAAAAAATTS
jgi:hypothetical protein